MPIDHAPGAQSAREHVGQQFVHEGTGGSAANLALGSALLRGRDGSRRETVTLLVSGAAAAGGLTAYFRSLGVRPF